MDRLILDDDLRKKFGDGRTGFEVCDEAGNVVGHYISNEEYHRMMYDWAKAAMS